MRRQSGRGRWIGGAVAVVAIAAAGGAWFVVVRGDTAGDGGSADAAATGAEGRPVIVGAVGEPSVGEPLVTDPAPVTSGGAVTVVVTHAGWDLADGPVEVDGFVAGVVESGGTCRVTLTRGEEQLTAEGMGVADASTTICSAIQIGDEELDAGTWQAVLSYESPTSSGASDPMEILVPNR